METGGTGSAAASPRHHWTAFSVAALSLVYLVLAAGFVRPYLPPAGHGLIVAGDPRFAGGSLERSVLLSRPPDPTDHPIGATVIREIVPGSPAALAGLRQGDDILALRDPRRGDRVDLSALLMAEPAEQLAIWRAAYWLGVRGPIELTVLRSDASGTRELRVTLDRRPFWRADARLAGEWARRHLGVVVQTAVFIGAALVLLLLRSSDPTAVLVVLAFSLCAVAGGGPLGGAEQALPRGARELVTVFGWIATPVAFPVTGLTILHFPRRAWFLEGRRWLSLLLFGAAAPMLALSGLTALYLCGVDALGGAAVWDATHSTVYYASFAVSLALNVLIVVEGLYRYRRLEDPNEQRRIRLVVLTAVPGVIAFALKDGPSALVLLTGGEFTWPWWLLAALYALITLPAFGLTYAVTVHRVLAPRLVVRRSIQYALARRTLTLLAGLPALALGWSLVRRRGEPLGAIVSGAPAFYLATIALSVAALKYRDRARAWLDRQFFRQEYDARKILLSLVSRIRFETDPTDLAALVVKQIEDALHPTMVAMLAGGVEPGRLTPVTALGGAIDPLPLDAALVTMLRWSDEPLEAYLDDPRSPARRLPPDERAWLRRAGAALLVPACGQDRSLVALLVLGEKRSEEPYAPEDRELLASIATQVGLGIDVARLRQRAAGTDPGLLPTMAAETTAAGGLSQCPACGRCEDATVTSCPTDGTSLAPVPHMVRIVDAKYRVDQLIGRGGMGAVYRARDMRLDRNVAIKVVRHELLVNPEARTRFRREAQVVARLQHPAVVSVFDYGTLPLGGAYLVMEFVRGEDLRQVLRRETRLDPARAARIMSAVCAAIDAAHREGIFHRDLKPENVLLVDGGPEATGAREGGVKVLDFGIAKSIAADRSADTSLTVEGTVIGTPAYMAPEQLRGAGIDARTDVFSLGVMMYEMLAGELPFGSGSIAEVVMRQAAGAPPIRGADGDRALALARAVGTAISADPGERPATPRAFAESIQSALAAVT